MSRGGGKRTAPPRAAAGVSARRQRSSRSPRWIVPLVAVVVLGIAAALLLWKRPREVAPAPDVAVSPALAPADTVQAHLARRDYDFVIAALESRLPDHPRDSGLLLTIAALLQDDARAMRTRDGVPHPATRTSLDRMALEQRALAFTDSALACAASTEERAQGWARRAEILAGLGLPIEALEAYLNARESAPTNREYALRVAAYEAFLADPVHAQHVVVGATGAPAGVP